MTDLGANAALVQEVIDFAEQGSLLTPAAELGVREWEVVSELDEALAHAHRRATIGADDAMTWTNLREHQSAEALGVTYERPELAGLRDTYDELTERFYELGGRLNEEHRRLAEEIANDLANIALTRAVFGANPDRLFEQMFQAYRAGGWPCGWLGAYPAGKLVVYDPSR